MLDRNRVEFTASFDEADLEELTRRVKELFDVRDRRFGVERTKHKRVFVGEDAVQRLIDAGIAADAKDAVCIGNMLLRAGVFHHVKDERAFEDDHQLYRFLSDEEEGAEVPLRPEGSSVAWADFVTPLTNRDAEGSALQPATAEQDPDLVHAEARATDSTPAFAEDAALLEHARPPAWCDPEPAARYELVVLGGGTAGFAAATMAAGLGARVALVEGRLLGGERLCAGGVPSGALLASARAAAALPHMRALGVRIEGEARGDFAAVMARMRELRAGIAAADSAARLAAEHGIDVFFGRGRFTGPGTVEVDGKTLAFSKAVVATGAAPAVPPIQGLAEAPYLTPATVFDLAALPERLGVIGAGPAGIELAQAFQRLGSRVTVLARGERILSREEPDAAGVVADALRRDGVALELGVSCERVACAAGRRAPLTVVLAAGGDRRELEFDALLVATGRKPVVEGLGLEEALVEHDPALGVLVDDRLQTTNANVFAAGDAVSEFQLPHVADFTARIAVRNALFLGHDRFSDLLVPWTTFTDPEVAHVGLRERDLEARGIRHRTFTRPLAEVERAVLDGTTEGFVRLHVRHGTDRILGATIVAPHAGDLIGEVTVAIQARMGLRELASVIHPHPTLAEAIRRCGDDYARARLTPTVQKIVGRLMALHR